MSRFESRLETTLVNYCKWCVLTAISNRYHYNHCVSYVGLVILSLGLCYIQFNWCIGFSSKSGNLNIQKTDYHYNLYRS